MAVSAREKLLDKKILDLEHRLVLVERFVEMRFCESFRDFSNRNVPLSSLSRNESVRNSSRINQRDENNKRNSSGKANGKEKPHSSKVSVPPPPPQQEEVELEEEELETTSYRTRSGRQTKRLTASISKPSMSSAASTISKASSTTPTKVVRINLKRVDATPTPTVTKEKATDSEDQESVVSVVSVVKILDESENESQDNEDTTADDYFTFPSGEDDAGGGEESSTAGDNQNDSVDSGDGDVDMDQNDYNPSAGENDDESEDNEKQLSSSAKRKSKTPVIRKTPKKMYLGNLSLIAEGAKIEAPNPDQLKECHICHTHWKVEAFDLHMESRHRKERHLKCHFCDKTFFNNNTLYKHERVHKVEKYARKCRLCSKVFVETFKVLQHERICIRKHLEANEHVNPAIMEDVRRRSKNTDLNWPDSREKLPEGVKKCGHCKMLIEENLLLAHLREQHAKWKCNFCDKKYVLKCGLVSHLSNAHGQNSITCNLCKKTFESRQEVRSHNSKCRREFKKRSKRKSEKLEEKEEEKDEELTQQEVGDHEASSSDKIVTTNMEQDLETEHSANAVEQELEAEHSTNAEEQE